MKKALLLMICFCGVAAYAENEEPSDVACGEGIENPGINFEGCGCGKGNKPKI